MLRSFGQLLHNISLHDPTMLQEIELKYCLRVVELLPCQLAWYSQPPPTITPLYLLQIESPLFKKCF